MHTQSYANPAGYFLIIIGLLLSLVSALVPHFEAGYRLMTSVFVTGMLPYMVYAIAVPVFRDTMTTIVGLLIVVAHTWLVFTQRLIGNADYSDGMIYLVPMVIALAVVPFVIIALKKQGMI